MLSKLNQIQNLGLSVTNSFSSILPTKKVPTLPLLSFACLSLSQLFHKSKILPVKYLTFFSNRFPRKFSAQPPTPPNAITMATAHLFPWKLRQNNMQPLPVLWLNQLQRHSSRLSLGQQPITPPTPNKMPALLEPLGNGSSATSTNSASLFTHQITRVQIQSTTKGRKPTFSLSKNFNSFHLYIICYYCLEFLFYT